MCAFQLPKNEPADLTVGCPFLKGAEGDAMCPHLASRGMSTSGPLVGLSGLFLVGLNHHTAEVGLREKFFTDQLELMLGSLRGLGLAEVAVLFTCNRIEVYGSGGTAAAEAVIGFFAARCGMTVDSLRTHLYVMGGQDAALHLMRVAAGLESVVLGESQILGQVADSAERSHAAGTVGPMLSRVFGAAVVAGKRARSETGIGRHTLSVSHAGVMLAKASCPDFATARVLIVGAGEMAKLAIAAVRSNEGSDITVINRTPNRAQLLAAEFGVWAEPWTRLRQALGSADIVIAATSSSVPVIGKEDVAFRSRGAVLIDLGMPRNIDRSVTEVAGVELHDVDDLQQVVEQHRIQRQREVASVEIILAEEMNKLLDQLRSVQLAPVITGLRRKIESLVETELEKTLGRLQVNDEMRVALELMAHRISSKVLHQPTVALRSTSGPQIAPAVYELFGLRTAQEEHQCKCAHANACLASGADASEPAHEAIVATKAAEAKTAEAKSGASDGASCPFSHGPSAYGSRE